MIARTVKMTSAQADAVATYVTDPAFDGEPVNMAIRESITNGSITLPAEADAWEWAMAIHDGANSADQSGDHAWCKALTNLASKVARI